MTAQPSASNIPANLHVQLSPPRLSVFRPDDLLFLDFEFVNLVVSPGAPGAQMLGIADRNKPGFIIMHLPPQSIGEQALWEKADQPGKEFSAGSHDPPSEFLPVGKPVASRLSGTSRLVFALGGDTPPFPLSLQRILETCAASTLNVSPMARLEGPFPPKPAAQPPAHQVVEQAAPIARSAQSLILQHRASITHAAVSQHVRGPAALHRVIPIDLRGLEMIDLTRPLAPSEPAPSETAIEMPYRLVLSPNEYGTCAHAATPVRSAETGCTELWHTRVTTYSPFFLALMSLSQQVREFSGCSLRALWTPDLARSPEPFTTLSLDAQNRRDIVHLSAGWKQGAAAPGAINADRVMLSALGGWLDSLGQWNPSDTTALTEWRHIATMGRDHYVRVVERGYLWPFGHRASLVKVTERKFHPQIAGNPAYLRQRLFIVVREPDKSFPAAKVANALGHRYDLMMPFRRVRITTMVTPSLDKPDEPAQADQTRFYPKVDGSYFLFHLVAQDLDGKDVEFSLPLLFVDTVVDSQDSQVRALAEDYERRPIGVAQVYGQHVVFADSTDPQRSSEIKPGNTMLETVNLSFGVEVLNQTQLAALRTPCHFYPALRRAQVIVPAIKHLAQNSNPIVVAFDAGYLQHGFPDTRDLAHPNAGQVFLSVIQGTEINFSNQADRSGGLITPNMQVSGLSRLQGPVAGTLDTVRSGRFEPTDFFKELDVKLFGVFHLTDILQAAGIDDLSRVPRLLTEGLSALEEVLQDLGTLESILGTPSGPQNAIALRAGIPAAAGSAVANDLQKVLADFDALMKDATSSGARDQLTRDLNSLCADLPTLVAQLPDPQVQRSVQKLAGRLAQVLAEINSLLDALQSAEQLTVKFEWKPKIHRTPESAPIFEPKDENNAFELDVELHVKRQTTTPAVDVYCGLRNFVLHLVPGFEVLDLDFAAIEFIAGSGKTPDVNVKLNDLRFVGCLSFIQTLRHLIPLDGFSDPPALSITQEGIDANYSIGLPSIGVGVMSLENISLSAGLELPFIGKPLSFRFHFCERHQPFLLTVSLFGGGGFFGLDLDAHGIQMLEGAFEFGGNFSLDLGVASGGVHVLAGIYFAIAGSDVTLDGYLRIGGGVEVLGIVSMSIELHLDLEYESKGNVVRGEATLVVEVSVLFFSASVPLHCEKTFSGAPQDPTFEDLMKPDPAAQPPSFPWVDYCSAFA